MKITIIGTGYVGLTSGTCFAEVGHDVICVDHDQAKIETLLQGKIPIYEPKLADLVKKNVDAGRLNFTTSTKQGVEFGEAIFIAVPTPPQPDGSVDLSFIEKVSREIAACLSPDLGHRVIVDKSTVPVKTGDKVEQTIARYATAGSEFSVASNPEFLREGSAVDDLLNPDRVVFGSNSAQALSILREIYQPFNAPMIETDINSSELIKHAANSFLALKISYINAISAICEKSDANVEEVAKGIGLDHRIGSAFLNAGLGYGGSCFPKDIKAFIAIAEELGQPFDLLKEVERINERQLEQFLDKIKEKLWVLKDKKIALWGLAFKSNTDDVRESIAIKLAKELLAQGASVHAYDPKALETAKKFGGLSGDIHYYNEPYALLEQADALVIATEWQEFTSLDFPKVKQSLRTPLIFDGRNLLDPAMMNNLGFEYVSIGR